MAQPEKGSIQQITKLIELNDELENYFTNTIIPQLFVDADLILRKFTPPAMKQFSFSPSDVGKHMAEMVDHIRYSTILENIKEVIKAGEIFEKEIQTDDKRWFQMNIIPYIIKKENRTNGVIITFIDISGRMKNLRELEKLNASHETFIYSVSHDLKAPLANIEGLVTLLVKTAEDLTEKHGVYDDEHKEIAAMLGDSVKSMRKIIDELSDIAKIEGNYKDVQEVVVFENIFKEVEMTVKDKINQSKAVIDISIGVPEIKFSRKNLRSILYNLLINAINYKSPDRAPEIFIKTEHKKGYVLISVKDNGIGIAPEKKEAIFTPYTRYKKEVEGTGIGLYLVKKIIENAGGKIKVTSKPGKGSEFQVYLRTKTVKAKQTT
ncbi:sensor histidine kinase [Pontibacter arcticus]|uniref:histidine kinase n=1 Tax=Pontibacter arcticus TaxID=2080288 RepID=A0A364RE22_9BACT|nr:ATP-binding protein [Pontibacter arcticus]RAU82532.1 ATP-binding protein [Pontibacter arcticus]